MTRCSSDTGHALLLALLWLPASRLPQHIPVRSDPGAVAEAFPGQSSHLKQASAQHRRHNKDFAAVFHFSHCLSDTCQHQPPTQGSFVILYGDGWPVIHWPPQPSHCSLFWQWLYHGCQASLLKINNPRFLHLDCERGWRKAPSSGAFGGASMPPPVSTSFLKGHASLRDAL